MTWGNERQIPVSGQRCSNSASLELLCLVWALGPAHIPWIPSLDHAVLHHFCPFRENLIESVHLFQLHPAPLFHFWDFCQYIPSHSLKIQVVFVVLLQRASHRVSKEFKSLILNCNFDASRGSFKGIFNYNYFRKTWWKWNIKDKGFLHFIKKTSS